MKYFKRYKDEEEATEITKDEARKSLEGWYDPAMLDIIFNEEKGFRLFTAYAYIWTQTEDGLVPMAGFYGFIE